MSRRTRSLVPVTTNLLYPKVVDGVQESLQLRRQKAKSYFDKNAKTLPELDIGQDVQVAGQRKKTCQPGKCLKILSDRSYLVQTDRETVRRNREDLRPRLDADKATSTAPSLIPEEAKSTGEADTTKPQTPATSHPSMARKTIWFERQFNLSDIYLSHVMLVY